MTIPMTAREALQPTDDPAWILDQRGFDPLRDSSRASRFAISNGFLGIRAGRTINRLTDAAAAPRTYVAGLFDTAAADQPVATLMAAPDWLRIDIALLSPSGPAIDDVSFHRRTLDFKRGMLLTESGVSAPAGLALRLRVLRVVSLHSRSIGLQVVAIDVDAGHGEATLEASFEGLEFGLVTERLEQDLGLWSTNATGKRLAIAASASLSVDGRLVQPNALGPFRWAWTWTVQPGQAVRFERIVALVRDDTLAGDPVERPGTGWRPREASGGPASSPSLRRAGATLARQRRPCGTTGKRPPTRRSCAMQAPRSCWRQRASGRAVHSRKPTASTTSVA